MHLLGGQSEIFKDDINAQALQSTDSPHPKKQHPTHSGGSPLCKLLYEDCKMEDSRKPCRESWKDKVEDQ